MTSPALTYSKQHILHRHILSQGRECRHRSPAGEPRTQARGSGSLRSSHNLPLSRPTSTYAYLLCLVNISWYHHELPANHSASQGLSVLLCTIGTMTLPTQLSSHIIQSNPPICLSHKKKKKRVWSILLSPSYGLTQSEYCLGQGYEVNLGGYLFMLPPPSSCPSSQKWEEWPRILLGRGTLPDKRPPFGQWHLLLLCSVHK